MPISTFQVFPPSFRELPPPPLELFDLDEEFASSKIRLAQVTNKCTDDDLAFYIQSIGTILNVPLRAEQKSDPKAILHMMLTELCDFKFSVSFLYMVQEDKNGTSIKMILFAWKMLQ